MDRRNFLQLAALAIAGKAAERVFPFRVYSIPKIISAVPKEVFGYMEFLKANTELLTGVPEQIVAVTHDILPVVGTIYGPDGSPRGHIKIKSWNGRELGFNSGVVRPEPGDLLVIESEIYPAEYHKTDPRTGSFLNLARS